MVEHSTGTTNTGRSRRIGELLVGLFGSSRRTLLLLGIIFLIGLVLRLAGIEWALPDALHPFSTFHPDETVNMAVAKSVNLGRGQIDIKYYNYGALYFYLVSFAIAAGKAYGLVPAIASGGGLAASAAHNSALFLCGRLVTAVMGILTVPIIFATGRIAYGDRAGLAAALVAAVTPLWVVHSQFLTVDVPATFFVSLALLGSVVMVKHNGVGVLLFAAVSTGLAAATKYNLGLVCIAPIYVIATKRNGVTWVRLIAVYVLVSLLSFVVGCPGAILHTHEFWFGVPGNPQSGLRYELFVHSRQGHGLLFVNTGPGWWYHLVVSLPWALGIPMEIASLCAVVFTLVRRNRYDQLLLLYLILTYLITSLSAVRFARYMIPLFPPMALLCGAVFSEVWRRNRTVASIIASATLGFTGLYTLSLVGLMRAVPPQEQALHYINEHVMQGKTIAFPETPWFYSPPLVPAFGAVDPEVRNRLSVQESSTYILRIPMNPWSQSVLTPPPALVVLSDFETMHPLRLKQKRVERFVEDVARFPHITFGPSRVWGAPPIGSIIPDDVLYIMPTVTLYETGN